MKKSLFPYSEIVLAGALLILIAALAYLPLVSQLGYYHDDWFTVASRVSGVSLSTMHYVDRPLMGKVYEKTYALLGDHPLNWHLFAFAVRCVGILIFFGITRLVWPKQRLAGFAMAALFAVYPGFLLQPNANNYQNHLIALALGLASVVLTLLALKVNHWLAKVGLVALSALLVLFYPRIYETMIGLEGLRWILIGCVLFRQKAPRRAQLVRLLAYGLPCLAAAGAFLVWRFFVFNSVRQGTDAGALLAQYAGQPLGMAARILVETGKDFTEAVILAWVIPVYQSLASLRVSDWILALVLGLAAAGVLVGYLRWQARQEQAASGDPQGAGAGREMRLVGLLATLITLLPVTLSGRGIQFSYNLDRYTLQSIAAVAILVVGLIEGLQRPSLRRWVIAGLLFLSVAAQYGNASYYRDFWAQQRQFWWQVSWRAPGLEPETVLTGLLPTGYRVAEDFEIWAPADLIYYPRPGMGVNDPIGVMALLLTPDTLSQIREGGSVPRNFRQISYIRRLDKTLVFSMADPNACVHLLDGRQVEVGANADPLVLEAAKYSLIKGIQTDVEPAVPPAELFGKEPQHSWCYYYQKASLARQKGDWQEVSRLGDEAGRLGLAPADVSEWLPFYEAAFHLDRRPQADRLAEEIRADARTLDLFCGQFDDGAAGLDPAAAALCRKP